MAGQSREDLFALRRMLGDCRREAVELHLPTLVYLIELAILEIDEVPTGGTGDNNSGKSKPQLHADVRKLAAVVKRLSDRDT